jgi:hypothetical protein
VLLWISGNNITQLSQNTNINRKSLLSYLESLNSDDQQFHQYQQNKQALLTSYQFLLCVFTFCIPCCDCRYDVRIKTMSSSSLPQVVCKRTHVLVTLSVLVFVWWCSTRITRCFCFVCLRLVSCVPHTYQTRCSRRVSSSCF